ncbi:MAG: ABC transporter permease [Chloroflexi bacterium]|nr:ABC transporter permease [Chloroflexota bacterium]
MKTIIQLYLANLKEYRRERMEIFWTLAFPILFMLLFGIIFSGNGNTTFDVGIANQDQGSAGAGLIQAFQGVSVFKVTTGNESTLMSSLKKGDLTVLLVIPPNMTASIAADKASNVAVYYDPTNQTTPQVVLPIVSQVVQGFNQGLTHQPALVVVTPKTVTAANLREIDFLLPGILAMSLMQLGLFATANVLVQLRQQQVLRRLGATPLPRSMLLISQVLFRLTIGLLQAAAIILVGVWFFNVHILGNPIILVGIVLFGSLMFIALGYLISGLARTQESSAAITNLINFPMMILSGIFFPLTLMPNWIRPLVDAMPLTYLADLLRRVMINSTPVFPLTTDVGVLAGWLVVCSLLALRFFRWE